MKRSRYCINTNHESKRQRLENALQKGGDIGIIESVSICNFMCHENLDFTFGPHINFIIGQNGSGKSAVLTAIILALGGRSSATGRYPNIKGFIKTGKQKAKIELVLKNCGNHAYKPDVYGSKVIVVREINSDGVSSYKLKSVAGKIISTHKEELNNIIIAMDIQVENPVSILTQESSRSFLTSMKPDKLYQIFYQGTGLDKLEKAYNNIYLLKEDAAAELQRKKGMLPGMEKDLKALKKILDTSVKVEDYKHQLVWANIKEMENILHIQKSEHQKVQKEIEIYKQEQGKCKEKLIDRTSNLVDLEKLRDECDAVMTVHRKKLLALKTEKGKLAVDLLTLRGKLSSFKREEQKTYEEMTSINERLTKDKSDMNEDERHREKEMESHNRELAEYDENVKKMEMRRNEKVELQFELRNRMSSLNAEINNCKVRLKSPEQQLQRLRDALKNKVNVFGPNTEKVLREINAQKHRFSKLPKGPIGKYLDVKESRWSPAIESCLSSTILKGFCCDNNEDSRVLKEILGKYYSCIPTIIVSKYLPQVHNVQEHKAQSRFHTVLDMLNIQDPVIANCLIDVASIENQILIENPEEAVHVMLNNPPKNCHTAHLMNCSIIALPFRFYSNQYQARKSMLSSIDVGERRTLEQEIEKLKTAMVQLESELNSLPAQINEIEDQTETLNKEIVKYKLLKNKVSDRIRDLQIIDEPIDKHCMQEDLQQLQAEHDKKQVEIQKLESDIEEYSKQFSCTQNEMNTHKELLQEESKKYDYLCSRLSSCGKDKETLASAIDKFMTEITEAEEKLVSLEQEIESTHQQILPVVRNAEELGPRIDTDRSCEELRGLITETEKFISQQSNYNKEELQQKYFEELEKVKEAKKRLSEKEKNILFLDKMLKKRREHFRTICIQTQSLIQTSYLIYIKDNFDGKLVFNTKARTLSLEAHPKKSGTKNKGGKCSILSGGERSFITIAFLLAMWDRIKSPFKILDEYDVFMDSNNRKLSIDLLIEQAKLMLDFQFIFLSPLSLPQIKHNPLIKIHQMPAPERAEEPSL